MKKIIATVLAMVMALALCTVAFADTTTIYEANKYWTKETTSTGDPVQSGEVMVLTPESAIKYNKDGSLKTAGVVSFYTIGSIDYVAVNNVADADLLVYTAADAVKPVLKLAKIACDGKYDGIGTAVAASAFGEKCGMYADTNYDKSKTYYTANTYDTLFVECDVDAAECNLLVDGKLVAVESSNITKVAHTGANVIDVKTGKVTGVVCSECGAAAVKYANQAAFDEAGAVDAFTAADGTLWGFSGKTVPATDDKNTSPKTFDAGIAMYVGMALTSVAGSAVVIGKKKEF